MKIGGKCGVCGDVYSGFCEYEVGGKYVKGIIVEQFFVEFIEMKIIIQIISYYKGFFEFRICLYNDICRFVVQECFDEYFMIIKEGFLESFYICFYLLNLKVMGKDKYYLILFILRGMCCEQCVLQWMYNIGKYICQWYGNRCILLLYFFFCNYFGMSILIKLY